MFKLKLITSFLFLFVSLNVYGQGDNEANCLITLEQKGNDPISDFDEHLNESSEKFLNACLSNISKIAAGPCIQVGQKKQNNNANSDPKSFPVELLFASFTPSLDYTPKSNIIIISSLFGYDRVLATRSFIENLKLELEYKTLDNASTDFNDYSPAHLLSYSLDVCEQYLGDLENLN